MGPGGKNKDAMGHDRNVSGVEDQDILCYKSDHTCDCCGGYFTYTDEVFLLEVGEAAKEYDGSLTWDILRFEDNGDYQYEPYILHFDCWEEILSDIQTCTQDCPPMTLAEGIMECCECKSTINTFEPFVASTFGEIQVSQRRPSGNPASKIERIGKPKPVCLPCMAYVIDEHFPAWEQLLEYLEESEVDEEEEER